MANRLLLAQRCAVRASPRGAMVAAAEHATRQMSVLNNPQPGVVLSKEHHSRITTTVMKNSILQNSITKKAAANEGYSCGRLFSSAAALDDDDKTTIPFKLADIGEGIKEVELLQWFVQEGDTVKQFDRICEVQSDKATVEITSRYDGIVESLAGGNVGDMIQVGDPLLFIQVDAADAGSAAGGGSSENEGGGNAQQPQQESSSAAPAEKKTVLSSQDSSDNQLSIPHVASQFHLDSDDDKTQGSIYGKPMTAGKSGKFLATPAVRKLGMEYNLDLSTLVGNGPNGRVLKSDVLTFLKESGRIKEEPKASTPQAAPTSSSGAAVESSKKEEVAHPQQKAYLQADEVVTLKGYSRLMIQTMTASQAIPHMGYQDDFNLTKLADYRKDLSPKVSILAFFIKATSLALKEYPIVNASWKDVEKGEVTIWANHNIGVAMDTPRGLVVPVIHNCHNKSLVEIQEDLNELKDVAAAGKLTEQHLTGATFSISNIGSLGGGTYMSPLIVPPQAAIGAMGTIQNVPRFDKEGNVVAAKIMSISWAGDHRMFDGATLARFSNLCKDYVEDPVRMLVAMS